jgi:Ca2+-binding EF-hand superfamily protein
VLPPVITLEQLSEVFDRDGDGVFTKRELKNRPDLFEEADRDRDGVVTRAELGDRVALVTNGGVEVTASGFRARWDLDGNGKVEDVELPEAARIVRRR